MKITLKALIAAGLATVAAAAGAVYFGVINVGADDPHSAPVYAILSIARDRSIEVRSRNIQVPDLSQEALIREGAGNYNSMCVGCHLAPGLAGTELSNSLYPAPPNLSKLGVDGHPAAAFWIIKHGIKSTGMPAWGKSMADPYIWGMVAFLQQLPSLDAEQYKALITSSGGHQHGGGESVMHNHEGQHGTTQGQSGAGAANQRAEVRAHDDEKNTAHAHGPSAAPSANEPADHADHKGREASDDAAPTPTVQPKSHTHTDGKEHTHAK